MDIKKTYGTSAALETEGVWVNLGGKARVKVARVGHPENRKLIQRLMKPHRVLLRNGNLPDDIMEKITIEAMAATVLLDWEGIEEDGKAVPYTRENVTRLLADYKDFRDQIAEFATNIATFQAEQEEAAVKN